MQGRVQVLLWSTLEKRYYELFHNRNKGGYKVGLFKPNVERLAEKCDVKGLIKALLYYRKDYLVVRSKAAEALVKIGASAVNPLIATLKEENNYMQSTAAEVLGKIGDKRAVEPLIAAIKDKDSDLRREDVIALGKIGDKRAVEPLIAALKDNDLKIHLDVADELF